MEQPHACEGPGPAPGSDSLRPLELLETLANTSGQGIGQPQAPGERAIEVSVTVFPVHAKGSLVRSNSGIEVSDSVQHSSVADPKEECLRPEDVILTAQPVQTFLDQTHRPVELTELYAAE